MEITAPDPFWFWTDEDPAKALFLAAAKGDPDAQAGLAQRALDRVKAMGNPSGPRDLAVMKSGLEAALLYSSLALAHGRAADQRAHAEIQVFWAGVIAKEGDSEGSAQKQAEALFALDRLVDAGDEQAASLLAALSPVLCRDAHRIAAQAQREMAEAEGAA